MLSFILTFAFASTCFSQTELGSEDDLTVLGANGTPADPDVEVKGFSVFGSTQSAPTLEIPVAPGNIFMNGYVQVSSGMYVAGSSTFTAGVYVTGISSFAAGPGSIYIKDGASGQVLKKVAGGAMQWADDEGGVSGSGTQYRIPMWNTDTVLTNSVMNQDAGGNSITLIGSTLTVGGTAGISANRLQFTSGVELSSASASQYGGVYVSTNMYFAAGSNISNVSTITASGNFGIATTAAAVPRLLVTPSYVGINTADPGYAFHVSASNSSTGIGDLGAIMMVNTNTTANNTLGFGFGQNNTSGALQAVASIDLVGVSHTVGAQSGALAFATRNGGSWGERMRIGESGYIGIGTADPGYKLHVAASNATTDIGDMGAIMMVNTNTTANNTLGFGFGQNNTSAVLQTVASIDLIGVSHAVGAQSAALAFATRNAGSFGERMRLSHAGNLGIGTTAPATKLHISSGILTVDGAGGGITTTSSMTFTGASGSGYINASTSSALGGGLTFSTNVYIVGFSSATKYYGDGASLTGLGGSGSGLNADLLDTLDSLDFVRKTGAVGETVTGVKTFSSSVTVTDALGLWSARQDYAAGVSLSSASPAQYGGVYVSTHIYVSSNIYAGENALYVSGGSTGKLLKKNAAGYLAWADDEGGVAGSGTQYSIPMWNTSSALTNSVMSQSATTDGVTLLNSTLTVQGSAFSVGGSTLAVSYGNVGIGTAVPGSRLEVAGGSVTFRGSDSNSAIAGFVDGSNNYRMVVSTAGDVGIGITAPTHKLHVSGNAIVTSSMSISGASLTGTTPVFQVVGGTLTVLANGSVGIGTVAPGSRLEVAGGSITFRGSDSNSAIAGFVDGSNNYRMVVSTAGDVGIGVTAPTHKLHVSGNAIVTSSMSISGASLTGTTPVFQVEGGTMTVLANGNVGIGTANPAAKLHVQAYEAGTNTMYVSTTSTAGEYSIAVSSTGITNIRNLVIENRTDTPPSPVTGQIWMRTDY